MSDLDPKLPSSEGLKRARQRLKEIYKKPPSDDLVKIISEIGKNKSEKPDSHEDIAARPKNRRHKEVDL